MDAIKFVQKQIQKTKLIAILSVNKGKEFQPCIEKLLQNCL